MSVVIYIAKFVVSFLFLVLMDKVWNRLKTWKRDRKLNKYHSIQV